jgi:hypothetical protein
VVSVVVPISCHTPQSKTDQRQEWQKSNPAPPPTTNQTINNHRPELIIT